MEDYFYPNVLEIYMDEQQEKLSDNLFLDAESCN